MVLASLRLSEEGIKFKTKRKYKEDTSVTNEVCFQAYKPSSFGAKSAVRGVAAVVTNCTLLGSRVRSIASFPFRVIKGAM